MPTKFSPNFQTGEFVTASFTSLNDSNALFSECESRNEGKDLNQGKNKVVFIPSSIMIIDQMKSCMKTKRKKKEKKQQQEFICVSFNL